MGNWLMIPESVTQKVGLNENKTKVRKRIAKVKMQRITMVPLTHQHSLNGEIMVSLKHKTKKLVNDSN